jgi:probable phosphoglycerate mutase
VGQPHVWVVRHGETEWSRDGRHTGRTDIDLTPVGEDQARVLAPLVEGLDLDLVLCSPRRRARRTAELAGLVPFEVTDTLQEWDYGDFEGRTTVEIRERLPEWTIWDGPWRGGETATDVAGRADELIARLRSGPAERVALVGHGHFSRAVGARWVGAPVGSGEWLEFDTASWSELGWDRGVPVLRRWNAPAPR